MVLLYHKIRKNQYISNIIDFHSFVVTFLEDFWAIYMLSALLKNHIYFINKQGGISMDWKENNEQLLEILKEIQKTCSENGIKLGIHHFDFNHISELWGHNNLGIIHASLSVIANCDKLPDDTRNFAFQFLNWNTEWKPSSPIYLRNIKNPTIWMKENAK